MSSQTMERARTGAPRLDRRQQLVELLRQLEVWLPAEEVRLQRARERAQPRSDLESRWQATLHLYEHLSTVLA